MLAIHMLFLEHSHEKWMEAVPVMTMSTRDSGSWSSVKGSTVIIPSYRTTTLYFFLYLEYGPLWWSGLRMSVFNT